MPAYGVGDHHLLIILWCLHLHSGLWLGVMDCVLDGPLLHVP